MADMKDIELYINSISAYPADEYSGKLTSIVDTNLFSGSNDTFRNLMGGYFFNLTDNQGNLRVPPSFKKFFYLENLNEKIYSVNSFKGSKINQNINLVQTGVNIDDPSIGSVQATGVTSQDTILPSVKFVCQLQGDPRHPNLIDPNTGNKYWEKSIVGGQYNNNFIEPIYTDSAFDDHYTIINLPYEKINKKLLKSGNAIRKFTDVSYKYNIYNPTYQNFVRSLSSEKQNINWYLTKLYFEDQNLSSFIVDYYGFNDTDTMNTVSPEFLNELSDNITKNSIQDAEQFESRQTNLLFNNNSIDKLFLPNTDAQNTTSEMPYYANISIDTDQGAVYSNIIRTENYSTNFLKTLKEVFLGQSGNNLQIDNINFSTNQRKMVSSIEDSIDKSETTTNLSSFKAVDFVEMLLYSHNNIKNTQEDFTVIDYDNIETKSAYDTKGSYRAYNTRNTLSVLNKTLSTLSGDDAAFYVSDMNTLMNLLPKTIDYDIESFNTNNPNPKYNEVLAYRVEKISGPTGGDLNTQNAIQNFWVFNSEDLKQLNLVDTQTKYGIQYTYRVYAYYLVKGVKYQFSDLQLTKVIGTVKEDDSISGDTVASTGITSEGVKTDNPIKGYCVEYYDPKTQETVIDLLDGAVGSVPDTSVVSSLANKDKVRIRNSSVSALTGDPLPPYFANFVTTVQPSLKLIEVPIQDKLISVADHPPNRVDVEPSFELNNSNKLVFNLRYQNFSKQLYPAITNNNELVFKNTYLTSNDLTEISKLEFESVSPARYVDVYRIDSKPKSYQDFENNLIFTIDKKIKNYNFAYKYCRYADKVQSNKKYYYLFKTRNDLGVQGHVSQIIEAELVNDGGYKYATFEVINESDMIVEKFKEISDTMSRVLQVSPNISQLTFDDSTVDYGKEAHTQLSKIKIGTADDLLWGKTFKIRLTSKKTGKKIDLNITYSDPNVNMGNN